VFHIFVYELRFHAIPTKLNRKQAKIFILSGNLILCESSFHIVKCLKSLDFKLFFVYTFHLLKPPFGIFAHNLCFILKMHDFLQSLLNVSLEWFISFSTKQ